MVSHASGARFVNLIGGSMLSFYDWYADLPVASPQVFGDQTDVPESGDWWDAGYLIMWGSNVPVTRTPDAHWMTEARYRGQKVVAVAPDYADNVKFADEWLPRPAGHRRRAGDGDGARHPQGVLRRPADAVLHRLRQEVHRPAVPGRARRGGGRRVHAPGKFLTAADLRRTADEENAAFKTVLLDARTGEPVVPNGSLGFRFGEAGVGRWNLDLGDVDPLLSAARRRRARPVAVRAAALRHPRRRGRGRCRAASRSAGSAGTWSPPCSTCCSRSTASAAPGCRATWPTGYDDADAPYTPAWQEPITGVPAAAAARIAREFAANAEESTRPLDDPDGRRHQPLVPLRHDLPGVPRR